MGCIFKKCDESYKKRKISEFQHFYDIKKGLKESMIKFNETFKEINEMEDWDELLNLKDESLRQEKLKLKIIKDNCKSNYADFKIIGGVFCLIHLIGIQESIIIINSLFSELVEELELMINNTPREYDFYEKLEINSYRILPEINVAMMTSSVGIFFLRHFGFCCSNITFQMITLILILLLFLLFDFHTNDKLADSYNRVESLILLFSYIFLSITVGCSSTLALKEFFDIISLFKKIRNEKLVEKITFYILSPISLFIIILINRKIITSISNKKHKLILLYMIITIFSSFILSLIFHCFLSIPLKDNDKKRLNKKELNKSEKKQKKKESDEKIPQIYDTEMQLNIPKENFNNNLNLESKKIYNKKPYIKSDKESGDITIKFNQSFPQSKNQVNELIISENNKKKSLINSTKTCTFCGYIYFQKTIRKKSTCICYYYTNKCTWLEEKLIIFDVLAPIIIELYCQLCVIGYNYLLTEKLLKVYSYKKNIKFYIALLILNAFFGTAGISDSENFNKNRREKKKEKEVKNHKCKCINENFMISITLYLFVFAVFTFISSICYIFDDKTSTRERWNNIIMAEFIIFKIIDTSILGFYDLFDNSDIINTSFAITFEKLIWMIIETIVYSLNPNIKYLILVQIIVSPIIIVAIIVILFYS